MTRLAIVLTGLVLLLLLPGPATAATVRSEFFGIVQGHSLDTGDINQMAKAKVRTNRDLLSWESIQPDPGPFSWGPADRFIGRLAAKGIRELPSVWGNPDWVSGYQARAPLDRAVDIQAWKDMLKALIARYGPGGKFWIAGGRYEQKFGATAPKLPIQAWQIWNEPNLKKFFVPYPAPKKYARLLKISHDAIQGSKDPNAPIVLGGMPSAGTVSAWSFLADLYSAGAKPDFDIAALHPYAKGLDRQREDIQRFRNVMTNHGDGATPLWLTEVGWGSHEPDRFGINKGLQGQATFLKGTFNMVLKHRKPWNVQRLFWYHWRDPAPGGGTFCSFCASAGLVKYSRKPKPAHPVFKSFTAETTPPVAKFTAGPAEGSTTTDPTPTFQFTSNEPGSTFQCNVDGGGFLGCSSPYTLAPLADGSHTFSVRAIDAPGNLSALVTRSFSVNAP